MCEGLLAIGIPLWHVALFVRTLHPQILGRRIQWRQGAGVTFGEASYGIFDTAAFRGSPVAVVYREGRPLRFRLDSPEARAFPQLDELRAEGGTEYVAVPIKFSNGEVHVGTWATRHPGGFTDAHRAALETLIAPLARVTENYALRRTATNLLDTYVGRDAGSRILAGFPLAAAADPRDVCRAALAAAAEVRDAVAALSDWPSAGPRYGVALHIGELLYGNIGAANRLDFTCIGPAVNLAARLEEVASQLRRTTVFAAEFAAHCGGVVPLGDFALAGFREPQPVYGLAD